MEAFGSWLCIINVKKGCSGIAFSELKACNRKPHKLVSLNHTFRKIIDNFKTKYCSLRKTCINLPQEHCQNVFVNVWELELEPIIHKQLLLLKRRKGLRLIYLKVSTSFRRPLKKICRLFILSLFKYNHTPTLKTLTSEPKGSSSFLHMRHGFSCPRRLCISFPSAPGLEGTFFRGHFWHRFLSEEQVPL